MQGRVIGLISVFVGVLVAGSFSTAEARPNGTFQKRGFFVPSTFARLAAKAFRRSPARVLVRNARSNPGYKAVLPLSTQTYLGSDGKVHAAPSNQKASYGSNPHNGSRTANGYTVFRNSGGAGTAMDSSGNIRSGYFTTTASTGHTVFVPDSSYRR